MALILLTQLMSKNTFISRRMFVLALGASGVCHAAKPLIDFDISHGALTVSYTHLTLPTKRIV